MKDDRNPAKANSRRSLSLINCFYVLINHSLNTILALSTLEVLYSWVLDEG
jgi:hypothetical protein